MFTRKKSFQHNPLIEENIGVLGIEEGEEGFEGGGGDGGEGGANSSGEPFSVPKEEWEATQSELAQLRADRERFSSVEREFGELKQRLSGSENKEGDGATPDRPDMGKYPNTREGANKYIEDLAEWKYKVLNGQQSKQAEASRREQEEAQAEKQRIDSLVTSHQERVTKFMEKAPDFDAVASKGIISAQQHPKLTMEILSLDNSAQVEYHLAKNPQEAMKLIRLSASNFKGAQRELFRLDDRFSEEGKKGAARRDAERRGAYSNSLDTKGEVRGEQSSEEDDEDFVRQSFGLKAKN